MRNPGVGLEITGAAGATKSTVPETKVELVKFVAASVALAVSVKGAEGRLVKVTENVPLEEFCVAATPFTVMTTSVGDSAV